MVWTTFSSLIADEEPNQHKRVWRAIYMAWAWQGIWWTIEVEQQMALTSKWDLVLRLASCSIAVFASWVDRIWEETTWCKSRHYLGQQPERRTEQKIQIWLRDAVYQHAHYDLCHALVATWTLRRVTKLCEGGVCLSGESTGMNNGRKELISQRCDVD